MSLKYKWLKRKWFSPWHTDVSTSEFLTPKRWQKIQETAYVQKTIAYLPSESHDQNLFY